MTIEKHVAVQQGDGNGNPARISFSIPGLMAIIAFLGLVWPVALLIRSSDLSHLYDKIAVVQAMAKENEQNRKDDIALLTIENTNIRNDIASLRLMMVEFQATQAERNKRIDDRLPASHP
jgi:hypothetical protein